jgi:acetyltransferase-like isoleucine patch superfamily enzyme
MCRMTSLSRLLTTEFRASPWRTAKAMAAGRSMIVGRRMRVRGIRNITIQSGVLSLGIGFFGFADTRMNGLIRVRGSLIVKGNAQIGLGNRWDIAEQAVVTVGSGSQFSPDTLLVSSTGITIGENCAISWQCQFLDDDFHTLAIGGADRPRTAAIALGDHVWVGSRSLVLKGTRIADGCVIAANSLVSGVFDEPSCLIAGSPARVIKHDISWR